MWTARAHSTSAPERLASVKRDKPAPTVINSAPFRSLKIAIRTTTKRRRDRLVMRDTSSAASLRLEDLLETVHRGQLRSSGLNEIGWGLNVVELSDDVCEATRFVHRSPLKDVPLEPVPGLFQIGRCPCQPRLIGRGNSKLELPAVEIQEHKRVRNWRLVLLG